MVLKDVYVGMKVVDNVGHDIGTVQDMKIGDPQAVTAECQTPPAPSTAIGICRNAVTWPIGGHAAGSRPTGWLEWVSSG